MKIKPLIFCMIVLVLMAGSINVEAAHITAENPPANQPWSTEHVDWYEDASVGTHLSIAHHPTTGVAYISFYDAINGDLWMAREVTPGTGDCHNNDDWDCTLVDSTGNVGRFSSIDVVRVHNPPTLPYTLIGISYYDATNHSLKYARYRSDAVEPWVLYLVDAPGFTAESVGSYTSMKFGLNNQAVIGYHAQNGDPDGFPYGAVKIAYYEGTDGTGCNGGSPTWSCETIDSVTDEDYTDHGSFVSIDFDYDDSLTVAFYNSDKKSLDYAWYQGFGGSCSNDAWNCVTIDDGLNRGKYISLHAADSSTDKMRLAYFDHWMGELRYAEYVGSGGNCTSSTFDCYVVDEVGTPDGNYGLSIDVDNQELPIIAYMDVSEDQAPAKLRIARPAVAYGLDHGNCGADPDTLWLNWQCTTIDGGASYADEAAFVGVSVSPAGLATIAYSEYNNHDDETYLKVAQQHFATYLPVILK